MAKLFLALCLCALSVTLSAQALETFTSPDGVFQFKHSPLLIRCMPQPNGDGRWWAPDACNSQAPLCDDMASSLTIIVCFARPGRSEYFVGALFVAEVQPDECMEHWPNTTCKPIPIKRKDCLAGSPNWMQIADAKHKIREAENVKINSSKAMLFHTGDAWLSGGLTAEIYRVFHHKKCYELGIQEAGVSLGPFDPEDAAEIDRIAKEDEKKYGQLLPQALHSFRFLR